MNQFQRWYLRNHTQITWFIIGWLVLSTIQCVGTEDWVGAAINGGLAVLNYKLNG